MRYISRVQFLIGFTIYNPKNDNKKNILRDNLIELFLSTLKAEPVNQSLYRFSSSETLSGVKKEIAKLCALAEQEAGMPFEEGDFVSLYYSGYLANASVPKEFWDKIIDCRIK